MAPTAERHPTTSVFVGYHKQFHDFCRNTGRSTTDWKHVHSPHQLMGLRVDQVKIADGFPVSDDMKMALEASSMHRHLTQNDRYRIGEEYGNARQLLVTRVSEMSSWSDEDRYPRIAVCYSDGSKTSVPWEVVARLRGQEPPPLRLWFEPNCSNTCMWCGEKVPDDELEAHEEKCGDWS